MSLTQRVIRNSKPEARTRIIWDDNVKGLGLRITPAGKNSPKGARSFVLSYRAGGRKRLMTLARTAELPLDKARALAGEYLVSIRAGGDPLHDRTMKQAEPTVAEAAGRFENEYMPRRKAKGRMSETTEREYKRQIAKYILPKIGKLRVKEVTRADVERLLLKLPPVMANRVCALISSMFTQFEHWEYRHQHTNPARGIEKSVEEARDRTFSESELSALGKALSELPDANPHVLLAIRLAAVTGLRIGEVQNMQWSDLDFESRTLTLPKSKTGRRIHTMPSAALALLADATRLGACVIPGRNPDRPLDYKSIHRVFVQACNAANIEGTRIHDLRRTIMTEAAALGVGAHLLRDFVGHKTTAMAERYARQAGAPLTELRERMGQNIANSFLPKKHREENEAI